MWGHFVYFVDKLAKIKYEYKYYSETSYNEDEAIRNFEIDNLRYGSQNNEIVRVEAARRIDFEYFEKWGDCFRPPNAKFAKKSKMMRKAMRNRKRK